jgi:hypothetical protein
MAISPRAGGAGRVPATRPAEEASTVARVLPPTSFVPARRGNTPPIHVTIQVAAPEDPARWERDMIAFYHRLLERALAGRHSV